LEEIGMPKPIFNVLTVVFLVIGLFVGVGIGSLAFPQTIVNTVYQTETETSTVSLTETVTQVSTVTSMEKLTTTLTAVERVTETATKTVSITKTEVQTVTITSKATVTVYPTGGEPLMTDRGSGSKNTKPFTLNETADLRIEVYLRGSPEYAGFHWYLVPVGAEEYEYIDDGEVDEEVGSFEFYVYQVPPGNYYLNVLSANVKWEVSVYKLTAE